MNTPLKKELTLKGLNCANCAAAIEAGVKELPGVTEASLNFTTRRLVVALESEYASSNVTKNIACIAQQLEPGVKVLDRGQENSFSSTWGQNINFIKVSQIILSALLLTATFVFDFSPNVNITLYIISYLLVGAPVLIKAGKNLVQGRVFDENFLMSLATVGALAIQQFAEGIAVMLFYQIGEFFQDMAVNKSRKSITDLMNIRPDFANLQTPGGVKKISPEEVRIGDVLLVKPGEKIPLDGIVMSGQSMVDTSALTGESMPRPVQASDEVLSGFINKNGLISLKVTREFNQSTVAKILEMVESASSKKAPMENFITKFAGYYTPSVVVAAVLLVVIPLLVIPGATFSQWLYRALIFLVISCPCALVISIPLSFFAGIGAASRNGILVKGGNYLEALNNVDTIVFDKTGTLTCGIFKVSQINNEDWLTADELLEYAATVEGNSNHPVAISIVEAFGKEPLRHEIEAYEELAGYGVKAIIRGKEIFLGNDKLMDKENIARRKINTTGTVVHVAIDNKYAGYLVVRDEVKKDSPQALKTLKQLGVKRISMLTGDSRSAGATIAELLGIDEFHAELLPHEKVEQLEVINRSKPSTGSLVFVGDGINDAPVLARADVGVAMGGLGSDAAIEAADVVLMMDEPSKLVTAIKIARKTRHIVVQNMVFALGIKGVVLLLGAVGIATMWSAVFADVGVTVIAVLNSLRALR